MKDNSKIQINDHSEVVWARRKAFPQAPEGFGWIDQKNKHYPCASLEELKDAIRKDRDSRLYLVWTPDSDYCCLPEEVEDLLEPIKQVRRQWASDDLNRTRDRLRNLGIFLIGLMAYMSFQAWAQMALLESRQNDNLPFTDKIWFILKTLSFSTSVGFSFLGFLIFGFIPWYQARKKAVELVKTGADPTHLIPLLRFETWLTLQKSPLTWVLLILLSFVLLAQMIHDHSIWNLSKSIELFGLDKTAYRNGEFSRLFTAPLMHGGIIHFAMNALGLAYLGKRMEVFARWPHLPTVFLLSMLVGGELSARLSDTSSVGASGGLMGCLGFLLVFEILHSKLVPKSAYRRLLGGIFVTALIGIVGYKFIDNGAHIGGLMAGILYSLIVFTKSNSTLRPKATLSDCLIGSISLLVIVYFSLYVIYRMVF